MVQDQPSKKVHETLSQPIKAGHGSAYLSSHLHREAQIRGSQPRPAQAYVQDPIQKNN
jgi:hypothetical protein